MRIRISLLMPAMAAEGTLVEQYDNQDHRFAHAFSILGDAIGRRAFPCASVAVTQKGKILALKALGRFTYEENSPGVTPASVFDIASLTKVVATTTTAAILYERGLLDLEAAFAGVVPEFAGSDPRRREVTFRMLLAHNSGLPAYEKLFLRATSKENLLQAAFSVPLKHAPGTHAEYSDIGFILLGVSLERVAGEPIDQFCQREIFGRVGMGATMFNPPKSWKAQIPPTADDRSFRKRIIQGEVQDENAGVMGGVAGHAGLFSTAADLAAFAHAMLNSGKPILRPETIAIFTRRQAPAGSSRALGWDTPSKPSQSGHHLSNAAFGHLGFTGTSLWIDPELQLSITLLTNRTWPDCSKQAIKQVRPQFHDAVVEALEGSH